MLHATLWTVLAVFGSYHPPVELMASVEQYWSHLVGREKVQALEFVEDESQSSFLERDEFLLRNWRLLSTQRVSDDVWLVTVSVERMIQGAFYDGTIEETWLKKGEEWKVRMPKPADGMKQVFSRSASSRFKSESLRIEPSELKIHFLSGTQRDSLVIWNGTEEPAEILEIETDDELFELSAVPERLPAKTSGTLHLKYVGHEIEKNLQSEIFISIRTGDRLRSFPIPITYNYLSPAALGLLGLSRREAQDLEKTDKVKPKLAPLKNGSQQH